MILTILITLALTACENRNQKSYLIENWSSMELSVTTPEETILMPGKSVKKISSSGEFRDFTYFYQNHFARIDTKNEHPTKTVMVIAYTHKFSVHVGGQADSAHVRINGTYKKAKLPYYWCTNSISTYRVEVTPIGYKPISTSVKVNDREIDEFNHKNGEQGILTGTVNL